MSTDSEAVTKFQRKFKQVLEDEEYIQSWFIIVTKVGWTSKYNHLNPCSTQPKAPKWKSTNIPKNHCSLMCQFLGWAQIITYLQVKLSRTFKRSFINLVYILQNTKRRMNGCKSVKEIVKDKFIPVVKYNLKQKLYLKIININKQKLIKSLFITK